MRTTVIGPFRFARCPFCPSKQPLEHTAQAPPVMINSRCCASHAVDSSVLHHDKFMSPACLANCRRPDQPPPPDLPYPNRRVRRHRYPNWRGGGDDYPLTQNAERDLTLSRVHGTLTQIYIVCTGNLAPVQRGTVKLMSPAVQRPVWRSMSGLETACRGRHSTRKYICGREP